MVCLCLVPCVVYVFWISACDGSSIDSHFLGCCFFLLMITLALQSLFSILSSYSLNVDLNVRAIGVLFSLCQCGQGCLFYQVYVAGLVLRPLINPDLNFVQCTICIWMYLHSSMFRYLVRQPPNHHMLKISFSHCIVMSFLWNCPAVSGFTFLSSVWFQWPTCLFYANTMWLLFLLLYSTSCNQGWWYL